MAIGIILFALMIVPSVLVWRLISAFVFRITKDDDMQVLVAAIFMCVMASVAGLCLLLKYTVFGTATDAGDWMAGPFIYCSIAAALVAVMLALKTLGFVFESVVAVIRGD